MAKLRTMVAVGAIVGGAALVSAVPASAATAAPAAGGVTPGQCVYEGGGTVFYNVGPAGQADGHGICRGGRYNGQQIRDPSGRPSTI